MAKRLKKTLIGRLNSAVIKFRESTRSRRDLSGRFTRHELDRAAGITTVVLPLGPYRNLTTMTAALYALHPNAVVLNHAGQRVFGSTVDPFAVIDDDRWLRFKAAALRMLQHGRGGGFGGSVLKSHAFYGTALPEVYAARFGDVLLKPEASVLFWKESMRLQNRFMGDEAMFDTLLLRQPQVRFIYPVRNPLDCTRSNLQRGHWRYLVPKEQAQFGPVLERVLRALQWFRVRERRDPDRFLSFTELEIDGGFPERVARFSRLPAPASWAIEDAPHAVEVVSRKAHAPENLNHYARLVADLFADDPAMRARLEAFL
jgi:hypothetical protein